MIHKYAMGIIGNGSWLALINDFGNVSWLCWPHFDSSFLFGNLLDKNNGGNFQIQPQSDIISTSQKYLNDTNILITTIETKDGRFEINDFAPIYYSPSDLIRPHIFIRKIIPKKGTNLIKIECSPTYNYGGYQCSSNIKEDCIHFNLLDEDLFLYSSKTDILSDLSAYFILIEPIYLIITNENHKWYDIKNKAENLLFKTKDYWETWVKNLTIPPLFSKEIIRSALTLNLHVFNTGATIAAATTSLPEFLGSTRNWDYRFCWMRDSYYTLLAFFLLDNEEVIINYTQFLALINEKYKERWPPLHPISLDKDPNEFELNLPGYLNEKPVRIGNQAFEHIQNDIYGQVITTLLPYFTNDKIAFDLRKKYLPIIFNMLNMIEKTMDEPDNGLWEFRGLKQCHCYTYLFHWAGCKSALKIADLFNDENILDLASKNLPKAIEKIENCYDHETGLYYQAIGNKNLDASLLQLITMHYLKPEDPKAKRLLSTLEEALSAENGLFYRYLHQDDFGTPDATFLICAFWYIETLAIMDNKDKAISNLTKILNYGNHLNLFSEDVHAKTGSQWGNFPQTYSHAGLIQAVNAIHNPYYIPLYI